MRSILLTLTLMTISCSLMGQAENVGIGTTTPHPSAKLEVSSSNQGLLIPRMTCEERDSVESPADGLLVYVTDTCDGGELPGLFYFTTVSFTWKPIVNIFILNANTLDEAYDQGGPGAGRTITADAGSVTLNGSAANKTLEVSNTTMTAIDVTTTTGIGMNVGVAGGNGIDITNTIANGIEITTTGTGGGIFSETLAANAKNVIEASMMGNSAGMYYDLGGRAGLFTLVNAASPRPALQGQTLGTTYGVLGITDVFSSFNIEPLPVAGVAGMSVSFAERNGVSGLARTGTGVWGRTAKSNGWTVEPSMMKAGVFGASSEGFGATGGAGELFTSVVGYTSKGIAMLAQNAGVGHGVVAIAKGAGTATMAGVWGMTQEGTWAGHTTEFPYLDDTADTRKGRVAILAQSKADIGMWAESQTKFGLVATIGPKLGLGTLPMGLDKIGVFGVSSHATGVAAMFANTAGSTAPTVGIISLSSTVGLHVQHDIDMGRAVIIQNGMLTDSIFNIPVGGKQALFVQQNLCDFNGVDIRLDCEMSMASTLVVSNVGLGKVGSFSQINPMAIGSTIHAVHEGLGKVGNFELGNPMNTMPAVDVVNAGKGNGMKIISLNDSSAYALYVENMGGSPVTSLGGVARFNQTATSTAAAQTVLISSSTTTAGHKTLVVTPSDMTKTAAEFGGKVDILGDLTTTKDVTLTLGSLDISSGDLSVGDDATIGGSLTVTEGLTVSGGGFTVTGVSTHTGNLNIVGTMEATVCICPSDIRFKKNITPISDALADIRKLNGVYYYWKRESFPDRGFNGERQMGFVAQELEQVFPETVMTGEDGYKAVNYAVMTAVLVEAMKEQQAMIDALRVAIEDLRLSADRQGIKEMSVAIIDDHSTLQGGCFRFWAP